MRSRTGRTGLDGERRAGPRITGAWRGGPFAVRNFRLLSVGQLTSTVGDFCYAVALPWLVLSSHGGTVLLGTVLACYGVPRTVLIPLGGALADRLSPRAVMLAADAVRCVLVTALAVLAARRLDSLALLGPVAGLLGAGEGVFLPASAAIMPTLLPPQSLQAGNGISAAMVQVGAFAGPILGGILVTTAGPAPAFGVDAASFAGSAIALAAMRLRPPAAAPAAETAATVEAVAGEPAAGDGQVTLWRLLRHARELQTILVIAVLANFTISGTFEVALPALAHLRFGAAGYGALVACIGIGSVAGTLTAANLGKLARPAIAACGGFLIGSAAIAFVPFLGGLAGAAAAALVFGGTASFGNVVTITLLQRWAPARLLGRVMSLVMLASIGAFPVSVALAGVLVHAIGPAPFFPAAGVMLAIAVLASLSQRQFRRFGASAPPALDQAAVVAR